MGMDLEKLREPMPCKWKPQSTKNNVAICVAYVDAREVQKKLDEVCGIANWQSRHKEVKGLLFCEIGILVEDKWIWKSDVGTESNIEKAKGESSDSFKRAAVMWGIGRFLYDMKPFKMEAKKHGNGKIYPYIPEKQKLVFDNNTLTKYIEWKRAQ